MAVKYFTYTVTAQGTSAYVIDGETNPNLELLGGNVYTFVINTPGQPFYIKTDRVLGSGSAYDFQVVNNGVDQGEVVITLPIGPAPKLFYQSGNSLSMGGALTNVKHIDESIKHLVGDQIPGFVSAQYPLFQKFLEAYYEWMERPGNPDDGVKNLLKYQDVDTTVDLFLEKLEAEFMAQIPKNIDIDRRKLLKNIRSFYASKGTEKSYEFLFNILFNETVEFYYPKNDILKASDGKWTTDTSIRVQNPDNHDVFSLVGTVLYQDYQYTNPETNITTTEIYATALVERIIQFYLGDNLITEIFISNYKSVDGGDFLISQSADEDPKKFVYAKDEQNNRLEFPLLPMMVGLDVIAEGSGYSTNTLVPVQTADGDIGVGATAQISNTLQGRIVDVSIINGGVNYAVNDRIVFEDNAEIGGTGAFAFVSDVSTDGLKYSSGSLQFLGRGTDNSPVTTDRIVERDNGESLTQSTSFFVHGPGTVSFNLNSFMLSIQQTGGTVYFDYFRIYEGATPEELATKTVGDEVFLVEPTASNIIGDTYSVSGDKYVRLEWSVTVNGATTPTTIDTINISTAIDIDGNDILNQFVFTDQSRPDAYLREGYVITYLGSQYTVVSYTDTTVTVDTQFPSALSGVDVQYEGQMIPEIQVVTSYRFIATKTILEIKMADFGSGYRKLPSATIISTFGTGAQIRAVGEDIGAIKKIRVLGQNFGANYYSVPTIDLSNIGDGNGIVTARIGSIARHPGSFKNDDGRLSEAKYLQDNKYYQTFSYVLRTGLSIENYRDTIKKLVHPSGMELFGEVFITNKVQASLYDNFRNDPNDRIILPQLGNISVPKYRKLVLFYKTFWSDLVTYGDGEPIHPARVVQSRYDVENDETIEYQTGKIIITLNTPSVGPDPTDIEVFSFPTIVFPIQRDIENIIIDNTIQTARTYTRGIRDVVPGLDVAIDTPVLHLLNKKFLYAPQTPTTVEHRDEREIHLYGINTEIESTDSRYRREIMVGVGEIRDIQEDIISQAEAGYSSIKDWGKSLLLTVSVQSYFINKLRTAINTILSDGAKTTADVIYRHITPEISIYGQTPVVDTFRNYQKEINKVLDASADAHSRWTNWILIKQADLTIDVTREIHRQTQTHSFLLMSPHSVDVQPKVREEKLYELQVLIDSVIAGADWKKVSSIVGLPHENILQEASRINPIIVKSMDLTVDVQRELHRHWTTHNYLLTSPRTVEVKMQAVDEKTNEIQILIGLKEIRDYAYTLISEVESQEIRKLDPTFLSPVIKRPYTESEQEIGYYPVIVKELDLTQEITSQFIRHIRKEADVHGDYVTSIHGSVPVESMLKLQPVTLNTDIELVHVPVDYVRVSSRSDVNGAGQIDYVIVKGIDLTSQMTSQYKSVITQQMQAQMQKADWENIVLNSNLFNGFIYKIEDRTIGSFDPDNTAIRSIANSQLVTTSQVIYKRDSNNNILETL